MGFKTTSESFLLTKIMQSFMQSRAKTHQRNIPLITFIGSFVFVVFIELLTATGKWL